jgi:hypothetical protein
MMAAGGGCESSEGDEAEQESKKSYQLGAEEAEVVAGGDAAGMAETRGDPALVKPLALAFRWRRMLEEGRYASVRELAKAEGVNRTYIGRLLNLTLLAPDLVEAILDGARHGGLTTAELCNRALVQWEEQCATHLAS